MTMRRYRIIANPTAGSGAGGRAIPQIERLLSKYSLDYDLVRTVLVLCFSDTFPDVFEI